MAGPTPQHMVRIETLTSERLDGAHLVNNAFIGARKAACGCCFYSLCPGSLSDFKKTHGTAAKMEASAVAVRADGTVVGFVKLQDATAPAEDCLTSAFHQTKEGECYVEKMAVSAGSRGQGLGTRLLEWSEQTARARNATKLTIGYSQSIRTHVHPLTITLNPRPSIFISLLLFSSVWSLATLRFGSTNASDSSKRMMACASGA